MFIRVHPVSDGVSNYRSCSDIVINTSQITKIQVYDSSPLLTPKDKEKYSEMFDANDLTIFDVTLSTGENYLIIGPTKAYDNIK